MTPRHYEELVAANFRLRGYSVELTPSNNDYGVDAFACKGDQKLAIQAKMYGGTSRKVNREMVMQLHGAKDYFDCTEAVIVTNGDVAESARKVATKLQITILSLPADQLPVPSAACAKPLDLEPAILTFEKLWERYIMPLTGRVLVATDGRTNTVLRADWSGVKRLTSNGREQFIPIEIFRHAVGRILDRGCATRAEINEGYAKRGSSGVVLILSQVPIFEHLPSPSRLVVRRASQA